MSLQASLAAWGVPDDTLTPDEKRRLDADGYLPLEGILSVAQAHRMHEAMEAVFAAEHTGTAQGASETGNLQNKSDAFDLCVTHPKIVAAIAHVLREDFVSLGVHARPNPPGKGHQGLHLDYGGPDLPRDGGEYYNCNSIWPLAEFTEENGATRVVPGSHRRGKPPERDGANPMEVQPGEIRLVGPVGHVFIFNSHLWHGAALNRSDAPRPNVTSFWSRRVGRDGQPVRNPLSPEAWARLKGRPWLDPPAV